MSTVGSMVLDVMARGLARGFGSGRTAFALSRHPWLLVVLLVVVVLVVLYQRNNSDR